MTPGEFKSGGRGLEIRYGFHDSPFGDVLLARTRRGICHLAFSEAGAREAGKMRLEGKEYIVREGDVMHFRFNV